MATLHGLSLEFSDRRVVPDTLEGINNEPLMIGAAVWRWICLPAGSWRRPRGYWISDW
jgi:hypothetical protein